MNYRIFKTRHFQRWMRKTDLLDEMLVNAVVEMANGLIDADLGGGVLKKRVALPGRGKRGSVRTLVATRKADRWIFVFGFEKNQQSNVSSAELAALQALAADLLSLTNEELVVSVKQGALQEIGHEHEGKT